MKLCTLLLALPVFAADPAVEVFPAQVAQVYRIRLDKGALLLESIVDAARKHGVTDGAVLTAVGALSQCTFHGVGGTKQTLEEDMEINHLGGLLAAGEPHLHVVLTNAKRGAFGGHLENGCRVGNRVELTLARFNGEALARDQGALRKKGGK